MYRTAVLDAEVGPTVRIEVHRLERGAERGVVFVAHLTFLNRDRLGLEDINELVVSNELIDEVEVARDGCRRFLGEDELNIPAVTPEAGLHPMVAGPNRAVSIWSVPSAETREGVDRLSLSRVLAVEEPALGQRLVEYLLCVLATGGRPLPFYFPADRTGHVGEKEEWRLGRTLAKFLTRFESRTTAGRTKRADAETHRGCASCGACPTFEPRGHRLSVYL